MKNLKVGKKFLIVLGSVIVLFLISIIVSISALRSAEASYDKFYHESHEAVARTASMNAALEKALKNISLATIEFRVTNTEQYMAEADACMSEIQENINWFNSNYTGDTTLLKQYDTMMQESAEQRAEITQLALANTSLRNGQAQSMILEEYNPKMEEAMKTLTAFSELVTAEGRVAYTNAARVNGMLLAVSLLCSAAAFGVAVVMAVRLTKSILKPVNELKGAMAEMEKGNLNVSIAYTSRDELGQLADSVRAVTEFLRAVIADEGRLLSEMSGGNFDVGTDMSERYVGDYYSLITSLQKLRDNMSSTLFQINQSAEQVSTGAEQVSSGAQGLSQGATEQASAIEELAATINEISASINKNAGSAVEASDKANAMGRQVKESNSRMQEMLAAMSDIRGSSSEIGKIIKTIEDIAFQTNILALNAAVEAARAGEAGKGFAVVADEVRNLAGKSAEASKNTSSLIEGSLRSVERGTRIADDTAKSLDAVAAGAAEVLEIINEISVSGREQAEAIVQITQGVDQISSVIQTNSATAEESAAASEELSGQAGIMRELTARFKLPETENLLSVTPESEEIADVLQRQLRENVKTLMLHSADKY
ncbi:methyl-accepting chemotaxis protein [Hungatella hathewayi]|uniref:methyl-accepting chemotaxis protein n=1 Tax=Hungatella hathewayi TaxID=154046 RepID=UPI003562F39E